jgi:hypothetical protein
MEMSAVQHIKKLARLLCCLLLLGLAWPMSAQPPVRGCSVKDGKLFVVLDRGINDKDLAAFIEKFDLRNIGLWQLVKTNKQDSLNKEGWKVEEVNEIGIVVSKKLEGFDNLKIPANILYSRDLDDHANLFPSVSQQVLFGLNRFKNKQPFPAKDDIVQFFLRGHNKAGKVYLAGSFNNWSSTALPMKATDSGWIAFVKLTPGKYWYKFVADGDWIADGDNLLKENDGEGNINSVFFKTNTHFKLDGFANAKNVFLAGSFNNWKPKDLRMGRSATGWELPLYLANGTHTYKFVVDGNWYADEGNSNKVPDGAGGHNSVVALGKTHLFQLKGFENAKKVMLAGSFNSWRDFELQMTKVAGGWELPYAVGPGNYEYKFVVDGKWLADPVNPLTPNSDGNSFLIIDPNYTFKLKGYNEAKRVYLSGDFNGWSPDAYPMKKTADGWVFDLRLPIGKTRYKFVVDGKWILDPENKLWEQNEFGTGNSIIWMDNKMP